MKLLNLGCGNTFHSEWTNVDFVSKSKNVIEYDLRKGIPFEANSFDVVYHSHVLEHFTKDEAPQFLSECYRVLKPEGTIRLAVPDLEELVKEYLESIKNAVLGDKTAMQNYEWIIVELLDQMVRNQSGGYTLEYLKQPQISNEEYVYKRIGFEGKNLRQRIMHLSPNNENALPNNQSVLSKYKSSIKKWIGSILFRNELLQLNDSTEALKIGKFRLSGEVHQWMYDRYSLQLLLQKTGFKNIEVKSAKTSLIENWELYGLDILSNGEIRKPDSLFIEAVK